MFCLSLFFPFSCSWLRHAKPELCWLPLLRLHVVLGTIKLMNPPMREGTGRVCKTAAHRPFSFDEGDAAFWGSWAPPPGSGGCPSALGLPLLGRCVGWVSSVRGLFFQNCAQNYPAFSNATFAQHHFVSIWDISSFFFNYYYFYFLLSTQLHY